MHHPSCFFPFNRWWIYFLSLILLMAFGAVVQAASLSGRVVGVSDGDTVTLLTPDNREVKIRLAEIDTPERNQPYGSRARQALSDLVFGKTVEARVETVDRYGRTVAHLFVGGRHVNRTLVQQGAAWVYRHYSRDASLLEDEAAARAAGRGLWALPEAQRVAPWEWRRGRRSGSEVTAAPSSNGSSSHSSSSSTSSSSFQCGAKRTCGQMASCAEARFYLNQCGLSRLDGDRDGTPCESLCR